MKRLLFPLAVAFVMACTPAAKDSGAEGSMKTESAMADETMVDKEAQTKEARMVIKEFAGNLGKHMKQGLQEGGFENAIGVCNEKAPEVAAMMSEKSEWSVGRTSLKYRNPENAPDQWDEMVLKKFEEQKAAGTPISEMDYLEVVEQDGQKQVRYMKAIGLKPGCLNCHAAEIDPKVEAKLNKLYPNDKARGYEVGDIRGAFTMTKTL